jgi:hypothetical protein
MSKVRDGSKHRPRRASVLFGLIVVLGVFAPPWKGWMAGATPLGRAKMSFQHVRWPDLAYHDNCKANGFSSAGQYVEYTVAPSGTPLAVVLVTCSLEDGTGPAALFVFEQTSTPAGVNLVATLRNTSDGWTPGVRDALGDRTPFLSVASRRIELRAASYEGDVARCCSNVFATLTWKWQRGSFSEIGKAQSTTPGER